MPGAIAAAASFVVSVFTSAGIVGTLARLGASIFLSSLTEKLFGPKISGATAIRGAQVTTRGALEYRKIVYGQAMASGPVVYNNVSGTENENLWFVIAIAGHESEDIVSVWLDGDEIPKADIDWTAGTGGSDGSGTGDVTTAKFVGQSSATAVQIYYYLGHPDQVVSGPLDTAFTDWGTNNRLRGVTYLVVNLIYDANTETVWQSGAPRDFNLLFQGRRIYDPRLDTTNGGSGSHRYDDDSTWEFSDNPALCVADYLMTYMAVDPATEIDWAAITTAADDCDVSVTIPSGSESRFTCNGVLSTGQSHRRNLLALLSSMDGKLSYSGGQWVVRASTWEASSTSLDEDNLAGPVEVRGSSPKSERFNKVRGFYADPDRKYELVEFQHVTAAEFVTRDNSEIIPIDVELPFTNSEYMAQRIGYRLLEQGDNQIVADITLNAIGAEVAIGDVVDLTLDELSWAAKTFRVIDWSRKENGSYGLTLREDVEARYTDPLVGEYTTKTASGGVTLPSDIIPAPTSLAAASYLNGVKLTWTNPAARLFELIEIWVAYENDRASATILETVAGNEYVDNKSDVNRLRYYWIRAVNFEGQTSNYEPNTTTTTVSSYPDISELPLIADPFIRLGASHWDVSDVNVTYESAAGLNGTSAIRVQLGGTEPVFETAARRGPRIWDVQMFDGMTVEVRVRRKIQTDPGGAWSAIGSLSFKVEDEDGSNRLTTGSTSLRTLSDADTAGDWIDETVVAELYDSLPGPRFVTVSIGYGTEIAGPVIDHDFIEATIMPKVFEGGDKVGLVPSTATVDGKALIDDGTWGDGTYIAQTSAESTASVTPTNYKYVPGDVRRYGVVGDGVTDDSAAVQAAFDSVGDGQGVVFPYGRSVLLTTPITMTSKDDVTIVGNCCAQIESSGALAQHLLFTSCDRLVIENLNFIAGEDTTYFAANTPSEERQFIDLVTCDDVTVRGVTGRLKRRLITAYQCNRLNVDGYSMVGFMPAASSPVSGANNAPCVAIRDCDYVNVSNGRVSNHGSAILSQLASANMAINNIVGSELHDNGIYLSSAHDSTVFGCSFINVAGDGIQVRGSNISISGCVMNNCDNFGIAGTGITSGGADSFGASHAGFSISGNAIKDCQRGIRVTTDDTLYPRDIAVFGNVVLNCTEASNNGAIEVSSNVGGISITGNVIRTYAGDNGIFVTDAGDPGTHVVISNNIISDVNGSSASSRGAIRVDDGAEITICGNVMADIDSGIGVRLTSCDGGVVASNIYEGGQVVRIPASESNVDIVVQGNRGSTILVDGDNNTILQNDAVVSGYPATSTTPRTVGQMTFASGEAFIATGVSSSSDWQQITP